MIKIYYDAKARKFIAAEGNVYFMNNFVFGDRWNCRVNNFDGSVKCTASETINKKYFEICLNISSTGLFTLTKINGARRKNLKCFKIRNWPKTGIITLTGGAIEERNAFFNDINSYYSIKESKKIKEEK